MEPDLVDVALVSLCGLILLAIIIRMSSEKSRGSQIQDALNRQTELLSDVQQDLSRLLATDAFEPGSIAPPQGKPRQSTRRSAGQNTETKTGGESRNSSSTRSNLSARTIAVPNKEEQDGPARRQKAKRDLHSGEDNSDEEKWDLLVHHQRQKTSVDGKVSKKVRGGFLVDVFGHEGFLPDSRADYRVDAQLRNASEPIPFIIQTVEPDSNKVVLTRGNVNDPELSERREETLEQLAAFDEDDPDLLIFKGYVKNLVEYGAFIDIGGVDGLLHIRNMSWRRIQNVSEVASVGDTIDVAVLEYKPDQNLVSFGLKQLEEDPWQNVPDLFHLHQRVRGRVSHTTNYGAFVDLAENGGVEGLVHNSKYEWDVAEGGVDLAPSVGDWIDVIVEDIDFEQRHIDLNWQATKPIPVQIFIDTFQVDDELFGVLEDFDEHGLTVKLPGNVICDVNFEDVTIDGNPMTEPNLELFEVGQIVNSQIAGEPYETATGEVCVELRINLVGND